MKAFKKVLAAEGRPLNDRWVSTPAANLPTPQIIEEGLAHIFGGSGPKPDGLFVLNDGLALPAWTALTVWGFVCPKT